jgi:hypothetical protein
VGGCEKTAPLVEPDGIYAYSDLFRDLTDLHGLIPCAAHPPLQRYTLESSPESRQIAKTKAFRHTIENREGAGAPCKVNCRSYEGEGGVMNWIRLALTVFAGGLVTSLTDWLFMGDWLYKRYNQYPEIWRHPHGEGEMKAIAWYTPLPFVTCAVFTLLCARLNLHSYSATLKLALAIWFVGPLPLLIGNRCSSNCTPQLQRPIPSDGW